MVRLANSQQYYHFAPDWGLSPSLMTYYPDERNAPPPDVVTRAYLFDDPDVAGAGGYHSVDPSGNPYIKVFVDPYLDSGGTIMESPDSVLVALTHELSETACDPEAAEWVEMLDGSRLVAKEVSDPVQDQAYMLRLVGGAGNGFVTDYVLPHWFNRDMTRGKFDRMGALHAPFTKTDGGYWIVLDHLGDWHDEATQHRRKVVEFGPSFPEWKKGLKLAGTSRASKRIHHG